MFGTTCTTKLRELSVEQSYDNGLYAAAVILFISAILMAFMPAYRYAVGHSAQPSAGAG